MEARHLDEFQGVALESKVGRDPHCNITNSVSQLLSTQRYKGLIAFSLTFPDLPDLSLKLGGYCAEFVLCRVRAEIFLEILGLRWFVMRRMDGWWWQAVGGWILVCWGVGGSIDDGAGRIFFLLLFLFPFL